MSRLVKVALVGRPNVGKSAIFNAICKKRFSIVDDLEGSTRDRLYQKADFFGFPFEIIDTGGMDLGSKVEMTSEIKKQAEIAIEEADSIIMVVDGRVGVTELDREIAKILHRSKKPLCLAINKIDNPNKNDNALEFHQLGIPKAVPVSAVQGFQIAELLEEALRSFDKDAPVQVEQTELLKIAIIGRPNVGKSSLLNALLGEERSIVSPIAATTRDSIDTIISRAGKEYLFIDTAGIRRKHKEALQVEKFAAIRTQNAIEHADIILLLMDSMQGMTTEEKKIAHLIEEAKKGCLLVFNKWDLAKGFRMEECFKGIEQEVPYFAHCPKLIISAKTKRNIEKIFPTIDMIEGNFKRRITTHALNKCLISAMQKYHPPIIGGKRLRVYYMAQVDTEPPQFVLFVNSPLLMEESYKKYLINYFRGNFQFEGVPLILNLKGKITKKSSRSRESIHPHEALTTDRDLIQLTELVNTPEEDQAETEDSTQRQ